jgi:hypothetical protein
MIPVNDEPLLHSHPLSEFEEWKKNLDVPAIQSKSKGLKVIAADHAQCPAEYEADWNYNREICPGDFCQSKLMCYEVSPQYSCTDPSRILLTDQSGKHHCFKFSEGK